MVPRAYVLALCTSLTCFIPSESVRPAIDDEIEQIEKHSKLIAQRGTTGLQRSRLTAQGEMTGLEVLSELQDNSSSLVVPKEAPPSDAECTGIFTWPKNRDGSCHGVTNCRRWCQQCGCSFVCQDEDYDNMCDCFSPKRASHERGAVRHEHSREIRFENIENRKLTECKQCLHPLVKAVQWISEHKVDILKIGISLSICAAGFVATGGGITIVAVLGIAWNAFNAYLATREAESLCEKGEIFLRFFIVNGACAFVGIPGVGSAIAPGMTAATQAAVSTTATVLGTVDPVEDSLSMLTFSKAVNQYNNFKKLTCDRSGGKVHVDNPCEPMPGCMKNTMLDESNDG